MLLVEFLRLYNVNGWTNQVFDVGGALVLMVFVGCNRLLFKQTLLLTWVKSTVYCCLKQQWQTIVVPCFNKNDSSTRKLLMVDVCNLPLVVLLLSKTLNWVSYNSAAFGAAPLSGYFLNFDGVKICMHKDADFAVSPFEHISGTTARAAQLYVKMQLIADHLGSCGILFDGDTF